MNLKHNQSLKGAQVIERLRKTGEKKKKKRFLQGISTFQ